METPQTYKWGPALWMLLHYSAERINSNTLQRLPFEEYRIWTNLLSSLRFSIPCPLCKKHYTAYFTSNPISEFDRKSIRKWLFNLHNFVNSENGKESDLTLDTLEEVYNKPFIFSDYFKVVKDEIFKSLRLGWSFRPDVQKTIRCLEELKRFYNFY